jgi:hypothetical protein
MRCLRYNPPVVIMESYKESVPSRKNPAPEPQSPCRRLHIAPLCAAGLKRTGMLSCLLDHVVNSVDSIGSSQAVAIRRLGVADPSQIVRAHRLVWSPSGTSWTVTLIAPGCAPMTLLNHTTLSARPWRPETTHAALSEVPFHLSIPTRFGHQADSEPHWSRATGSSPL